MKFILLFVILLIVIFPLVNALSLTGDQISPIIYEPGKVIQNSYSISGTNLEVEVTLSGDEAIFPYISLSKVVDDKFTLDIAFPETLKIDSGVYNFNLAVTELQSDGGMIGSLLGVGRQFVVKVYSYEKVIEASLSAPSINEGGVVDFGLFVESITYSDINDVHAKISVFDNFGKKLGEAATESKPLKSLSSISFTVPFDAKDLPLGNYRAEAAVIYDGKQKVVEDEFKIGNLDILIENHTSKLTRGFNDFKIKVRNNWGEEIQNVYAQLFIENEKILHTPSTNLDPWGEGELSAIGNFDFPPREYEALLKIFFEGEEKEEQITLEIIEAEKEEGGNGVLVILLIGITISLVLIVLIVYFKKKNKADKL